MAEYFLKRFLEIIPKLLIITVLIFFGMELLPIDPLSTMISPDAYSNYTPEQLEALRESLGLYDPAPIRYLQWMNRILHGDFGRSILTGAPISDTLKDRFPATLEICSLALLLSTIMGILMGVISAKYKNTPIDYANTTLGLMGQSVPDFFLALCFILLFSFRLNWLPVGGRTSVDATSFFSRIKFMIMPVVCLSISLITYLMRITRNSMLDVTRKDYVKTARAKGQSEVGVYAKHIFRNGCTPVVTTLLGRISLLVSGTTIIETVFNYPGMGLLLYTSISSNDLPVAMITLMLCAIMVLITSFLTDLAVALLDPRIRLGTEE